MTLHIEDGDVLDREGENTYFRFDPDKHEVYRDGERVTADTVGELDDVAERTGPPAGLIPGGKSLSGDGSHSPALRVVVSQDTADAVRARATALHVSVSKYLRRLIERDLRSA